MNNLKIIQQFKIRTRNLVFFPKKKNKKERCREKSKEEEEDDERLENTVAKWRHSNHQLTSFSINSSRSKRIFLVQNSKLTGKMRIGA
jgi:hypothetical protein